MRASSSAGRSAGIGVPPVFIVVCQNTAISKLVFEWIAGFERGDAEEGERAAFHAGHLELFRNYDEHGGRLPRPRTLLIDSRQLEAGEALDKGFREAAGPEIEQFKRELAAREGAGSVKGEVSESDLLREVMNTVGRAGRLGEQIRCVVSVSMLTEGWDTNTVTHILGVRAFGTQLLCEQVVGRGLRRQSYELNERRPVRCRICRHHGHPVRLRALAAEGRSPTPPKPVTRVHAIKERAELEIRFPRVSGYRRELPSERLEAEFDEDSRLVITPEDIGPTSVVMEGIVGAGVTITPEVLERLRSTCSQRRSSSSPRRMPVSIAMIMSGLSNGVRPRSQAAKQRAAPRLLSVDECDLVGLAGRRTNFTGLRGSHSPHSRRRDLDGVGDRYQLADDCRWGDSLQTLVAIGRDICAGQLGERPVAMGQRNIELIRDASDTAPRLAGVTSAQ